MSEVETRPPETPTLKLEQFKFGEDYKAPEGMVTVEVRTISTLTGIKCIAVNSTPKPQPRMPRPLTPEEIKARDEAIAARNKQAKAEKQSKKRKK